MPLGPARPTNQTVKVSPIKITVEFDFGIQPSDEGKQGWARLEFEPTLAVINQATQSCRPIVLVDHTAGRLIRPLKACSRSNEA
jgi:hypothetical protein